VADALRRREARGACPRAAVRCVNKPRTRHERRGVVGSRKSTDAWRGVVDGRSGREVCQVSGSPQRVLLCPAFFFFCTSLLRPGGERRSWFRQFEGGVHRQGKGGEKQGHRGTGAASFTALLVTGSAAPRECSCESGTIESYLDVLVVSDLRPTRTNALLSTSQHIENLRPRPLKHAPGATLACQQHPEFRPWPPFNTYPPQALLRLLPSTS
jgi:hypothetical protein